MWRAIALLAALPAQAESLVATRPIPARALITAADVTLVEADIPGALTDPAAAVGREARVALFPGRPLRGADLALPALVERNQPVLLVYRQGGLVITAEGRALGRAAEGEVLRALNLASRNTVSGRVASDGSLTVVP